MEIKGNKGPATYFLIELMRVFYDHQAFLQPYGGVSRYFCELIKSLSYNEKNYEAMLPPFYSDNLYLMNKRRVILNFKGKIYLLKKLNKGISKRRLLKNDFDLFHPTYYDPYFLKYLVKPFVITIHDMIHDLYPQFVNDDGTSQARRLLAQKAKKIIAVSENTKKDIVAILGIDDKKITVVYPATCMSDKGIEKRVIEEPYLLYIGERYTYKNFKFFIKAVAGLLCKNKISLLCGGGKPFSKSELDLLNTLNLTDFVKHLPISSDEELASLYRNALAFCYPSLYEGFGIPILEAFACGCPVVLSRRSSFPEVAGAAGVYFEPDDASSIVSALEKVINDRVFRNDIIKIGYQQLGKFSWEKAAKQIFNLYKEVLA